MKVETALELLLPTVQFGNVKLFTKVGFDTVTDLGRIEESQKRLGIKGDKSSTETVIEVTRKLAVDELVAMKREVDKLTSGTFDHEKFSKSAKQ